MVNHKNKSDQSGTSVISRRRFLKYSGLTIAGTAIIGPSLPGCSGPSENEAPQPQTYLEMTEEERRQKKASVGYILIDSQKCMGCLTCMLGCSMVHEGEINLSLSRIQVTQNPFGKFPEDISLSQCRQCLSPACVEACPEEALTIDENNGYLRKVDQEKCTGCMECVEGCSYSPSRAIWNFEKDIACKCDLCQETPFWSEDGGPGGKQACVELCPVGAVQFSRHVPLQEGNAGYDVNLRGKNWKKLGYKTS